MKVFLRDGRIAEVAYRLDALMKLQKARSSLPVNVKVGDAFEVVSISQIDLDRYIASREQLMLPKVS